MTRGRFISFEGTDGCGKTTQLRLLAEKFRAEGQDVLETAEPGGTRIGLQIRSILLDSANQELSPTAEMLLYFAGRAQNVDEWILPALERGTTVLSDRFTDSTLAYQGAARGLGSDVVMALHQIACRGLLPDLTIYLDIDLDTSLERAHARNRLIEDKDERRMDEQAVEFHHRVRQEYLKLAEMEPDRIKVIDGRSDRNAIAARIWETVHRV
ncbi:MAG TPA: dTMP kinase [Edaphobacter sp.]|nr:dTMP kinase [Edaphobacter sp.]